MEVLESLTSILVDIVRNIKFTEGKLAFIREHIKNAASDSFPTLEFPPGKDWFNVASPLTVEDLRGKIVVLDFFTYCCINCLHLLPTLKQLESKFPASSGLVVIGVHSAKFENEKKSANIALALKKLNITHPVINDSEGYLWNLMKISCWPTIVIMGPSGQALFAVSGENNKNELVMFAETALNFYTDEISHHPLPIGVTDEIVTSNFLKFPTKITRYGNIFALSDTGNNRVLVIDERGGVKYKIGGGRGFRDGSFTDAQFNTPQGLAFYNEHKLYVADTENHAIRLIDMKKFKVKTVVGTGVQGTNLKGGKIGVNQEISSPWDLCFVPPDHIHIACNNIAMHPPPPPRQGNEPGASGVHHNVVSLPTAKGSEPVTTRLPGTMKEDTSSSGNNVLLIAMCGTHQIWAYFLEETIWWKGTRYRKDVCAAVAGTGREENRNNSYAMQAAFAQPSGLTYCPNLACVFVADSESSSIRKISLENGAVSHVVGGDRNPVNLFRFGDVDGTGFNVKLQHPIGITYNERENALFLCDTYNNKLKKIDVGTFECTSINEDNEFFNEPNGCVPSEVEDVVYVADTNNDRIVAYNVNDGTFQNWVIEESDVVEPNVHFDDEWQVEADINAKGGLVILSVLLGGKDIDGNWNIDLNDSKFKCETLNGKITSAPVTMEFNIPPEAGSTNFAKIILHVTYCTKYVCVAKKFLLKLVIKRSAKANEVKKVDFEKVLSQ